MKGSRIEIEPGWFLVNDGDADQELQARMEQTGRRVLDGLSGTLQSREIRVCVNCWTVVRPEDEGACECSIRGQTVHHVDFVPVAQGRG